LLNHDIKEDFMALTRVEREQIQDSKLKLQSAAQALSQVGPDKIDDFADIQECLEDARKSLNDALKQAHEEEIRKPH
jgi:hypothetical protein